MFFHFVKDGDYIYKLSKQYKVAEEKIIEDNSLIDPKNLVINQCLLIDNDKNQYIVKSGDTLSSISSKFNLSIQELKKRNPFIEGDKIYQGQILDLKNSDKEKKVFNGYCYETSSLERIKKALPYLTYLSIFAYRCQEDGSLDNVNDNRILNLCLESDVKPIMVITNSRVKGGFSPSLANKILTNDDIRDRLFSNIENILKNKKYYGLNIDFEYVNQDDRIAFIDFIKKANRYFKAKGYYLSISLAPKTSDNQKGLLYTAHDYGEISKYVDHVILMTYEWGYTFGPSMPVAPYNEVKKVIEYATKKIDRNKIIMGIPNYGYDFIVPYKEKQKAQSITNPQAIPLAFNNHATIKRYKEAKTPYFKYTKNSIDHEVQYDDPCSIEEKLSIIDDYNIAGGSIWTISSYTAYCYLLMEHCFQIDKK